MILKSLFQSKWFYDNKGRDLLPAQPSSLSFHLTEKSTSYLEFDVVTYQLISLHELPLIAPVLSHDREGMMNRCAQDANKGLNTGVGVDISQVGFHDVTGS